jgi:hypothetical protein
VQRCVPILIGLVLIRPSCQQFPYTFDAAVSRQTSKATEGRAASTLRD